MQYTKLGHTGLDVSRICLGSVGYGGGNRGILSVVRVFQANFA